MNGCSNREDRTASKDGSYAVVTQMIKKTSGRRQEGLRVLHTDGRQVARGSPNSMINQEPDVRVVGNCSRRQAVMEAISRLAPDAVVLDIAPPNLNGLEGLKRIDVSKIPLMVFVQGCPRDWPKAGEVDGHDRMKKAVGEEKTMGARQRLISRLECRRGCVFEERPSSLTRELESQVQARNNERVLRRIAVKVCDRIFFLDVHEIDWIEACGHFVNLHVGQNKYLIEQTLRHLESKLDRTQFLRVHRSTIVNTTSIREMRRYSKGRFLIQMKDNTKLFSSRRLHSRIASYLGALK
jgi:two-component system LytT family response regulator